jgi:hypothetical protein
MGIYDNLVLWEQSLPYGTRMSLVMFFIVTALNSACELGVGIGEALYYLTH